MTQQTRENQIIRASMVGVAANFVLAAFKLAVGLLSHSIAIVLDAVNNASDVLSSAITVTGAKLAGRPADREHPFGHGRFEYLSAAVVSAVILYAGVSALGASVRKITAPEMPDYTPAALIVVAAAVLVKILLGRYAIRMGKQLHSDALTDSGRDALLDAVISASTLVSAILYLTFSVSLEAWLGVLISLAILKSGMEMFRETVSKILGERVDSSLAQAVKAVICETEGVAGAYDLILNSYGPDRWIGSVNIEVPETWTADQIDTVSREIAHKVAERNHVILAAIGIYSLNLTDDEAKRMRTTITELAMAHDYVLQIHGFYCDTAAKTLRFDLVIDFRAPDAKAIFEDIFQRVRALYPDYEVRIQPDSDYSD